MKSKGNNMYTVLTSAVVVSLLVVFACFLASRAVKYHCIGLYVVLGFLGSLAGSLIGVIVAGTMGAAYSTAEEVTMAPVTLVAMRGSEGFDGTFLLGTGSFQTSRNYVFYIKNKDGSLTPGELVASYLIHIVEDSELKDTGYWATTISRKVPGTDPWLKDWTFYDTRQYVVREEFRVPVGTVAERFGVN
jgi:hypothetical protein